MTNVVIRFNELLIQYDNNTQIVQKQVNELFNRMESQQTQLETLLAEQNFKDALSCMTNISSLTVMMRCDTLYHIASRLQIAIMCCIDDPDSASRIDELYESFKTSKIQTSAEFQILLDT